MLVATYPMQCVETLVWGERSQELVSGAVFLCTINYFSRPPEGEREEGRERGRKGGRAGGRGGPQSCRLHSAIALPARLWPRGLQLSLTARPF